MQAVFVPNEIRNAVVKVVAVATCFEQVDDVVVVRLLSELKATAVFHELLVLRRVVQAKFVKGHLLLLTFDGIIFLVLRASWETLPRQRSSKEIKEDMTNSLQIVSTRLLVANMGADGGVSGRTCEVLALTEGDVLTLRVLVALCETEIDNENSVLGGLGATDHEVVRLDISVDNSLFVNFLNTLDL